MYSNQIDKMFENYNESGMVLGYNKPLTGNQNSNNIYCYKVLSDECLMEVTVSFDRAEPPSFIFAPTESELTPGG